MHVNRFIHWAFEGRSCFCATRLVLTEFSDSRTYSTRVIHSFHSRIICRLSKILYGFVSVIHILYSKDVAWLVLYQADALSELLLTRGILMSYFIVWVFGYRCSSSQTSTRTENIFTVICLSLDGFIWNQHNRSARLVEHCTGVVEVMGSNPAQASICLLSLIFTTAVNSLNPKSY